MSSDPDVDDMVPETSVILDTSSSSWYSYLWFCPWFVDNSIHFVLPREGDGSGFRNVYNCNHIVTEVIPETSVIFSSWHGDSARRLYIDHQTLGRCLLLTQRR
jgi:hypothetical protein